MIIVANAAGQLCNRILLLAHTYASGLKTGQRVHCLYWGDLKDEFENINSNSSIILLGWSKRHYQIQEKIEAKIYGVDFRKRKAEKQNLKREKIYRSHGIHVVDSWYYRDYEALFEFQDVIRSIFKPKERYEVEVEHFISSLIKDDRVLVAIHIRRGDYRTWREGKYYYSDGEYKNWMECLAVDSERRIQFVLFSNEQLNLGYFSSELYDVCTGLGQAITDLYSMARCDYIIGPPSTYSWWAAFYGKKPYLTLFDKNQSIKFFDFKNVVGEEFSPIE